MATGRHAAEYLINNYIKDHQIVALGSGPVVGSKEKYKRHQVTVEFTGLPTQLHTQHACFWLQAAAVTECLGEALSSKQRTVRTGIYRNCPTRYLLQPAANEQACCQAWLNVREL